MTNVIELFPVAKTPNEATSNDELSAEKAFMEYLAWSMKMERDPHEKYDDPVVEFRAQNSKSTDVA